jgi:hypothetical protein
MYNIIEAIILNGKFKGEHVLLPCIPMNQTVMHNPRPTGHIWPMKVFYVARYEFSKIKIKFENV